MPKLKSEPIPKPVNPVKMSRRLKSFVMGIIVGYLAKIASVITEPQSLDCALQ
jgi:hypothetical protein